MKTGYWAVKIVSGVPAAIPVIGDFMVELLRGGESLPTLQDQELLIQQRRQ